MSKTILLTETTTAPVKTKGNKWMVTVATPGQGSSGFYSEELLKEQGPAALHPGAHSFIGHNPDRDIKELVGVFKEGGFWDEDSRTLKAELTVLDRWADFVEEVAPYVGMSIFFHGEADEEGNVTTLTPHPMNGVDLVARPGLSGSGLDERLAETLLAEALSRATTEDNGNMELEQKVDALTEMISQFIASQNKQKEGDEIKPEDLVAEALDKFQEAVAEIDKAELLPSQVADLRERAKRGEDVAPLIESAQRVNKELKEQFEASRKAEQDGVGNVLGGMKVESAVELGKVFG